MSEDTLAAWLALDTVRGLGPSRFYKLLEHYQTPAAVFGSSDRELTCRAGLGTDLVADIRSPRVWEHARKQIDRAHRSGVEIVTLADPRYPSLLAQIPFPPPVLYVLGDLSVVDAPCMGVVGTRLPTLYGKNATAHFVEGLVAAGVTIVSGLAAGIDTTAHETCLDHGGKTAAVLGGGIDFQLRSSRKALARTIGEKGVILSEFSLGTHPEPYFFPRRNRIISGLSSGVLVVEAGKKSGALITADYALSQGRDVFAVPGAVFSDKSTGTLDLIRNGATPVQTADHILEQVTFNRPIFSVAASVPQISSAFPVEHLNRQERKLVDILGQNSLRMDQLADATGIGLGDLFDIVLNLELKGVVRQMPGQQYVRT